jgi:Holliday junction resolvase RusA-like endonuclease
MARIFFEVLGEPVPKARHRTARLPNGRMIQYQDKKARAQEDSFLAQAVRFAPLTPIDGPLTLLVTAFSSIPQSWSRKKRQAAMDGEIRPTKKPDADNLLKFVGDALNGIFWQDDKQITTASISKRFSDRPRWEIKITEGN